MEERQDIQEAGNQRPKVTEWKEIVAGYQRPSLKRAIWQMVNSFGLYALAWVLMFYAVEKSFWLAVPFAVLAGMLLVRVFIIFHDCGHGSFLKSEKANNIVGFIAGTLAFTPYYHWRWEHSVHHATAGDLDRRGMGDVWTMTVREYQESSRWKRLAYRLTRNPFVLFVIAPLFLFLIHQRIPSGKANPRERNSVWWTNLAMLGLVIVQCLVFGITHYLMLQFVVTLVGGSIGLWMFYVQHQYENVYWERREDWDYTAAALEGSSFYKLPRILQWFSGNIGFHHIHHLSPKIPNYNLERCHNSHQIFRDVKPLTLISSLRSLRLRLWDEQANRLVGYRHLRRQKQTQNQKQQAVR